MLAAVYIHTQIEWLTFHTIVLAIGDIAHQGR